MDTAITTATMTQSWKIKMALTLLADTDRRINLTGTPATPEMPVSQPASEISGIVMDFPSLIAARLMSVAKPVLSQPKKFNRTPKKKG
jgi:hypothetical protein